MFDKVSALTYPGLTFFKNANIDHYYRYQFPNVMSFFAKFAPGAGLSLENLNLFLIKRPIKISKIFLYGAGRS